MMKHLTPEQIRRLPVEELVRRKNQHIAVAAHTVFLYLHAVLHLLVGILT